MLWRYARFGDQCPSGQGSPYFKLVESRLPGNNPACYGCSIEGFCAGQCHITKEVAIATNNGRFDYMCEFYRQTTKKLLETKLVAEIRDFKKGGDNHA